MLDNTPQIHELLKSESFDNTASQLKAFCSDGIKYSQLHKEISDNFDLRILDYDVDQAVLQWRAAQASWFLPKIFKKSKLKKELKLYSKAPDSINDAIITQTYDKLTELKTLKAKIESAKILNSSTEIINGIQTDWNSLYSSIEKTIELHNSTFDFTPDEKAQIINSLKNSDFTSDAKAKCEILGKYIEKWTAFSALCKIDKSVENSANWFDDLNAFLTNLSDNIYELGQ